MTRAVQRVVRSCVEWGVLVEVSRRGVFSAAAKVVVPSGDRIGPWLLEAGLLSNGRREYPLRGLVDGASFYPLGSTPSVGDVSRNPRLELYRQGLNEDVVVLKGE